MLCLDARNPHSLLRWFAFGESSGSKTLKLYGPTRAGAILIHVFQNSLLRHIMAYLAFERKEQSEGIMQKV